MSFFFSSRRRHTRCSLVTGFQTCALPISREIDVLCDVHVEHRALVDGDRGWPVRTAFDGLVGQALYGACRIAFERLFDHCAIAVMGSARGAVLLSGVLERSEEHTSELQSLMRISYAVFCLKKKKQNMTMKSYSELQ